MSISNQADFVTAERERVQREYQRRAQEVNADRYALCQPDAQFMLERRNRVASKILHLLGVFPQLGDRCLEVGCGNLGWLGELVTWGVKESDLHGIDLDSSRLARARERLPAADLRIGDAVDLPWETNSFQLVVASTLFTSVLDHKVRQLIADEISRVLAPGGALLWYDFAYDNPRNCNVRGIRRSEIKELFPALQGRIKRVTLAPPLTRLVAPYCWTLATFLESIPFLRSHLLAVLIKK
jgi:ubiquinone/menaquinone biosynthesis C-methylase UbiE